LVIETLRKILLFALRDVTETNAEERSRKDRKNK